MFKKWQERLSVKQPEYGSEPNDTLMGMLISSNGQIMMALGNDVLLMNLRFYKLGRHSSFTASAYEPIN